MTLIDGDRIVTAQLYDDEHEEFKEQKMSIIDYVNAYTDEGVTTADDVLDKIRAEIEKAIWIDVTVSQDGIDEEIWTPRLEPNDVFEIIDKYRAESEG